MRAELKRLHSPDIDDLSTYRPTETDEFCFLLQVIAGPEGLDGEEAFDVVVCTPKWIARNNKPSALIVGRHYLIVFEYNYERIARFIEDYCVACEGSSWQEVAEKLGRLGRWEFEDYQA
jgi:hypothetical protein